MDFSFEKHVWEKDYRFVVGLDEAGRGGLAGPVVAAAVMIEKSNIKNQKSKIQIEILKEVKDSKKLSAKKRKELYQFFTDSDLIEWATGRVGNKVIDRINIWEGTRLAMKRAVKNLEKKIKKVHDREFTQSKSDRENPWLADFLIVDGNMEIDLDVAQKSVIGADRKIFSCALASIIAKFSRDRAMKRYHRMFPQYGFAKHKGYPTEQHLKALEKHGPCRIHRRSFEPVSRADREIEQIER